MIFIQIDSKHQILYAGAMKANKAEIKKRLASLADVLSLYHVSRIGLFGSFVHGTQSEQSDIDLLVEFREPIDLFAYVNFNDTLSKIMRRKVDMVTLNGIKPAIREKVINEVEWIEGI